MKENHSNIDPRIFLGNKRSQDRLTEYLKLLNIDPNDSNLKGKHKLLYYLASFIVTKKANTKVSLEELKTVSGLSESAVKNNMRELNVGQYVYSENSTSWVISTEIDTAIIGYKYQQAIAHSSSMDNPKPSGRSTGGGHTPKI